MGNELFESYIGTTTDIENQCHQCNKLVGGHHTSLP